MTLLNAETESMARHLNDAALGSRIHVDHALKNACITQTRLSYEKGRLEASGR